MGLSNIDFTRVTLPMSRECEATLYFDDTSFLPVTIAFDATSCDTQQINRFTVPKNVPNGEVDVIW